MVTKPKPKLQLAIVETDPNVLEMDKLVTDLCVISCDSGRVLRFLKRKDWRGPAIKDMTALVAALVAATGRAQIMLHEISKPETQQRLSIELPSPKEDGLKLVTTGDSKPGRKTKLLLTDSKVSPKSIAA